MIETAERLSTGVLGLDRVLGGGLLRPGLHRRYTPGGVQCSAAVLKMRFSALDSRPHVYALTNAGVEMGGPVDGSVALPRRPGNRCVDTGAG